MSGEAVALSLFELGEPVPTVEKVRTAGGQVLEVERPAMSWGEAEGQELEEPAAVTVADIPRARNTAATLRRAYVRGGPALRLEMARTLLEEAEAEGRGLELHGFTAEELGRVPFAVLEDELELEAGDRVRCLGGVPAALGRPLADVVRVNGQTVTVRLCYDGSVRLVPAGSVELRHRRAELEELEAELEAERYESAGALGECRHCAAPAMVCACGLEAELEDQAEELEGEELEGGPVVVIPCGGSKLEHRAPAAQLYRGSYFRAMLRAALELTTPDRVRILSGRYGFVTLEAELEPYEQRIDEAGAVELEKLRDQVQRDPVMLEGGRVLVLAGRAYAERAREAFLVAGARSVPEWMLEGCGGIGEQLARAAAIVRGAELEEGQAVEVCRSCGEELEPAGDAWRSVVDRATVCREAPGFHWAITADELELEARAGELELEGRRCGSSSGSGRRCVLEVRHWGPHRDAPGVVWS